MYMVTLRTKSETDLTEHMGLLSVLTLKHWFYGNVMTGRRRRRRREGCQQLFETRADFPLNLSHHAVMRRGFSKLLWRQRAITEVRRSGVKTCF